jgi:hypothetical protein
MKNADATKAVKTNETNEEVIEMTESMKKVEMDELDAILSGDFGDGLDEVVIDRSSEMEETDDLDMIEAALEEVEVVEAAKPEPEAAMSEEIPDSDDVVEIPTTSAIETAAEIPDAGKTPRKSLGHGHVPSTEIPSILSDKMIAAMESDFTLVELDGLAKKVREKVINIAQTLSGKSTLSVYTKVAIEALKDQGELSIQGIKDAFEAHRPYGAGTLSAQSSQMMSLLPAMGIAERMGNVLKLNVDSKVLAELAL